MHANTPHLIARDENDGAHRTPARPIAVNINRVHEIAPWSRTTTYKLVADGRLPARKLGRSTLILVADLERFIDGLEQVA